MDKIPVRLSTLKTVINVLLETVPLTLCVYVPARIFVNG